MGPFVQSTLVSCSCFLQFVESLCGHFDIIFLAIFICLHEEIHSECCLFAIDVHDLYLRALAPAKIDPSKEETRSTHGL